MKVVFLASTLYLIPSAVLNQLLAIMTSTKEHILTVWSHCKQGSLNPGHLCFLEHLYILQSVAGRRFQTASSLESISYQYIKLRENQTRLNFNLFHRRDPIFLIRQLGEMSISQLTKVMSEGWGRSSVMECLLCICPRLDRGRMHTTVKVCTEKKSTILIIDIYKAV